MNDVIHTSRPDVSVVMAVYGNWDDLPATMDSIIKQTLADIEIVLIDDGNALEGRRVIEEVAATDSRIRLVVNDGNIGLTRSLIRGCELARADFIARIDCGDLMAPRDRLQCQLARFTDNDEVGLVSGGIEMWDLINRKRWRTRLKARSHEEITSRPRYASWADHPTVMFRKSTYEMAGGYDPDLRVGQDTELWPRMAEYGRIAGMDRVFAVRTLKAESISVARNSQQVRGKIRRIRAQSLVPRRRRALLLAKEYLKLMVPMKLRLEIRHSAAMEFVERIPADIGQSLDEIARYYFADYQAEAASPITTEASNEASQ
jgi:glycosyltransferase involved in cell wall biosynthesis